MLRPVFNLFKWETKWVPEEDLAPTRFSSYSLTWLTLFSMTSLFCLLAPSQNFYALLLVPFMARLMALDISYRILPNLYLFPLFLLGLMYSLYMGQFFEVLFNLLAIVLFIFLYTAITYIFTRQSPSLGGGDMKLMLVMAIWFPPLFFPWAIVLSVLLALPFFIRTSRSTALPFGPFLLLSFLLFFAYQDQLLNFLL